MKTYDDCSLCGGEVLKKRVQKACWWGDRLIAIIEDVPAGVCQQCGERYYEAVVLKDIERLLKNKECLTKSISIPLAHFTTSQA